MKGKGVMQAAQEEFVYSIFRRHCTGVGLDDKTGDFRGCLTDEHYFGTMFAYYNRAPETDCLGVITVADFSNSEKTPVRCSSHCLPMTLRRCSKLSRTVKTRRT